MNLLELFNWAIIPLILLMGALFSLSANQSKTLSNLGLISPCLAWATLFSVQLNFNQIQHKSIHIEWIPSLGMSIDLEINGFNLLMLHLIIGIGFLICFYSKAYFNDIKKANRFQTLLLLFMFAMSGLVLSNHLILTFIFWELTSILSFFMVAFSYEKEESRLSAKRALLVTNFGALFLLAGFIMLGSISGTFQISSIVSQASSLHMHPWLNGITILIILGCFSKSAQFPFHFWLPGAMSAPTPASAYLHSATMVKAGIFLLIVLQPVFKLNLIWTSTLIGVGSLTLLYGAFQSIFCKDLKASLAYTTIAVLGSLCILIGIGSKASFKAFCIFITAHALYKATLFMSAGIIDLTTGNRNIKILNGLRKFLLIPSIAAGIAALSMSGIPGTLGFLAKEYKYSALLNQSTPMAGLITLIAIISSALMMYSAFQVGWRPYTNNTNIEKVKQTDIFSIKRTTLLYTPPCVLAFLSLLFGLFPNLINPSIILANQSLNSETISPIKLWNGFNFVLILSGLTISLGYLLWTFRSKISINQFNPHGQKTFDQILTAILQLAQSSTQILLKLSLKSNILIITSTALVFIWWMLFQYGSLPRLDQLQSVELIPSIFCLLIVIGALLTCRTQNTTQAIIYSSICGLGTSMLFLYYGAPDLAITQISVDVLLLILFVAILAKLPDRIKQHNQNKHQWFNLIFSLIFGLTLSFILLKSISFDLSPSISEQLGQWSYSLANGSNVVNVILVDFRAFDTLGEITVLCISALGILTLSKNKRALKEGQQ